MICIAAISCKCYSSIGNESTVFEIREFDNKLELEKRDPKDNHWRRVLFIFIQTRQFFCRRWNVSYIASVIVC